MTVGTRCLWRKSAKPIFLAQICVASELSASASSSCIPSIFLLSGAVRKASGLGLANCKSIASYLRDFFTLLNDRLSVVDQNEFFVGTSDLLGCQWHSRPKRSLQLDFTSGARF